MLSYMWPLTLCKAGLNGYLVRTGVPGASARIFYKWRTRVLFSDSETQTAAAQSGEGGSRGPQCTLPMLASRECGSYLGGSRNLESPLHCFIEIRSIKIDP